MLIIDQPPLTCLLFHNSINQMHQKSSVSSVWAVVLIISCFLFPSEWAASLMQTHWCVFGSTLEDYSASPWSCTANAIKIIIIKLTCFEISQEQNTFRESRTSSPAHSASVTDYYTSSHVCFGSRCSSCKAGLLLLPLKSAGCMLDLILEGSQWVTHGALIPPPLHVGASPNSLGVISHIW